MDRYIIPHAKTLKPYKQGQLDALCGLYSAINAIRLAAYPKRMFTKYHSRVLMEEGIDYLDKRPVGLSASLTCGMSNTRRFGVSKHLIKFVENEWGISLALNVPVMGKAKDSRLIMTAFIEDNIRANSPVSIYLNGHYNHYTVICGFNQRSFSLYDSDGLTSIVRSLISIEGGVEGARHILMPKGLFTLKQNLG